MAARRSSPALTLAQLDAKLGEGLPAVIVAAGTEPWFRARVLEAVVAAAFPDGDPGGAVVRLDGQRPEDRPRIRAIRDELGATSLFAARRLVIVEAPDQAREGPPKPGKPAVVTQLVKEGAAAAGATLVLSTERPAKGRGCVSAAVIAKAGAWLVDCRALYDAPAPWERVAPYDHELARFLATRMRRTHGREMPLEVAHALTQRVGRDLAPLDDALRTLALASAAGEAISLEDLEGIGRTRDDPVWALVDAVLDGDLARATALVEQAFDHGVRDERGVPIVRPASLFMMIHRSLQNGVQKLLGACEAISRGTSGEEAMKAAGVPAFKSAAFLARCRRDPRRVLDAHGRLLAAEMALKAEAAPPRLAAERLVLGLTMHLGPVR